MYFFARPRALRSSCRGGLSNLETMTSFTTEMNGSTRKIVRHCEKQTELSTLFLPGLPQIPTPFSWVQTSGNESRDPFQPQVGSIWFQHISNISKHVDTFGICRHPSAHFRVLGALQVSNNQSAELKLCHPFDWNPTWVGLDKSLRRKMANELQTESNSSHQTKKYQNCKQKCKEGLLFIVVSTCLKI